MKKIYLILIIAVIAIIGVGAYLILSGNQATDLGKLFPVNKEVVKPELVMGEGYSVALDGEQAVSQAYEMAQSKLPEGAVPEFAVLYSSFGYNQTKLIQKAKEIMPNTKIYGYTSIIGTMTNNGFHMGGAKEGQAVSVMLFDSDVLTAGVGAAALSENSSPREVAKLASQRAVLDAGATGETPKIVFISTSPFGRGMEEEIVAGIASVFGPDVPIIGGIASGDAAYNGGWGMFAGDKFIPEGVVIAPIYTDLKVGYIYSSGFNPTDIKGVSTKFSQGQERILQEIDQKPAGVVLNDWLGGLLKDHLGTSDNIIPLMGTHPIAEKIIETGGFVNWALIYPWWFHTDNSLTIGVSAPEGTELYLMEGDLELLIKRPALTARLARSRGKITEAEVAGVVMDHCGGTMQAIPRERMSEIPPLVNSATGDKPFIGVFDSGNYGYFAGVGNRYGNMMVSMVVFGAVK